jgi:putative tricarboxylic transport membrane protein
MRIGEPKDLWAGLIFVAIGAGFVLLASQYHYGDMHRMGPAMFPTLVGVLLAALGAFIALRAFLLTGEPVPSFHARPLIVSLLAIVLFGVALRWLGLVAAVAVVVLVGGYAASPVRLVENAVLAAVMVLFSVAVFVWLLGLPLPLWPNS